MREDRAQNPQVSGGNRRMADDRVLIPLHELRLPGPVEPHPQPGTTGFLLRLRYRTAAAAAEDHAVIDRRARNFGRMERRRLWRQRGLLRAAAGG